MKGQIKKKENLHIEHRALVITDGHAHYIMFKVSQQPRAP